MNYTKLRKQIITLANLPRCEEPIISAYFNLQQSSLEIQENFSQWKESTAKTLSKELRPYFELSATKIENWLSANHGQNKSAAVFAREGEHPFFLPLTFKVPMEDFFQVDQVPAIYPLVEIKDRFNRFVVVLTKRQSARVIEMNLGETSVEILTERPEIVGRDCREWTREHYTSRNREMSRKFLKDKVGIVEQLMAKRGHNAIIIVGEPRYVNRLQSALPKHLQNKIVDQIRTGFSDERIQIILEDTIHSYLQVENTESKSAVESLFHASQTNGLASFGREACSRALRLGQADQLIISRSLPHAQREPLVRLASQYSIPIETVRESQNLDEKGSVGVRLRYRTKPVNLQPFTLAA